MSFRLRAALSPCGIAAKLETSKEKSKEKGRIFQDFYRKSHSKADYEIFLKKHNLGVSNCSFSLGLLLSLY